MKTLLFLLLCGGLMPLAVRAQSAGPWRVVYGPERVKREYAGDEDMYYNLLNLDYYQLPSETVMTARELLLAAVHKVAGQDSASTDDEDWGARKAVGNPDM